MEPPEAADEFEERAFSAAGPVFLVGLGLVLLAVLAVVFLFFPFTGALMWVLFGIGAAALLAGVAWGAKQNRTTSRRGA